MGTSGVLQRFTGLFRREADDPALDAAVERAIDFVEPRLKPLRGYPTRFRPAVAHGLDYARALADAIPGPIALNRETFNQAADVHAMFVCIDEVKSGMCVSQAMRDYIRDNPLARHAYALLGTRRREKNVLGMAMEGDMLRRDVPQTVVFFTGHTLANPAPTEVETREAMTWSFFEGLLRHVRRRLDARYLEKVELERERDNLVARLRLPKTENREELEARLHDNLRTLQAIRPAFDLETAVEAFEAVMLKPEANLYLEPQTFWLDGMGVQHEAGEGGAKPMEFIELVGFDRRRWTVTVVHCEDIGDGSLGNRLEAAGRMLAI